VATIVNFIDRYLSPTTTITTSLFTKPDTNAADEDHGHGSCQHTTLTTMAMPVTAMELLLKRNFKLPTVCDERIRSKKALNMNTKFTIYG
jgi:hypothetical protein